MNSLARFAVAAVLYALLPRAQAQWHEPLNCDDPGANGGCGLYGISLVQLLANPEKYDGKRVRVVGYVHVDANASGIYLHKEDEEHHLLKNGLWVQLAEGVSGGACQDSYVLVEGTYRARSTGHRSWSGAITEITRCVRVP
jgi:hypothetical protein